MRIEHILDSDTKAKLGVTTQDKGNVNPKRKKQNKGNSKRFSERELKELMGINKQTYKRVHGAIRRK